MPIINLEPGGARPPTTQESAWTRAALALCAQALRLPAASWVGSTVLELGQIGLETDTGRAKMGDGTTIWSSLAYSDVAVRAYADALIAAEVEDRDAAIEDATLGLWDDRGNFDASVNTFPTTGGSGTAGAIKKGDVWLISVVATSGPLNGVLAGATIRALVDVPGQTGGNWATGSIGVDQPARDAAAAAQATADAALPANAQAADVDPAGTDIALALAAKLALSGGTMEENAVVNLFNGSKWQQSTPNKGIAGDAGFSIICSAGYEYKFANGFLFILSDGSSTVRKVLYAPATPTATDDTTLGFTTDTTWETADGTLYRCTDDTATAALWEVVPATDATKLPLAGGTMDENAIVNLFNGSKFKQSEPNKGIAGTAGFSIICSVGYEYKFANGYLFILSDGSSTVRKVLYAPVAPTVTDDETLGYTTDTTWEMADGTPYYCLDASTGAAVWSRGQKPVGAYSIGELTGNVTLSLANGGTQYGNMSGNTTFQVPTGTPEECVSEITVIVRWADGAHTLDFHADIQRASDSAATFPKTLTAWKSYIFKLKYMGGEWCLVSLTGGFTESVD
jgi:hypothetical protein